MPEKRTALIVAETRGGNLAPVTLDLISCGHGISKDMGGDVAVAILAEEVGRAPEDAIAYGADRVFLALSPMLRQYTADAFLQALPQIIARVSPELILMGQTDLGRDLAPRLAARLSTGLVPDCVDIKFEPASGSFRMTRPVFGYKALAEFTSELKPQIVTLKSKTWKPLDPDRSRNGEIIEVSVTMDALQLKTRILKRVKEDDTQVALEDAEAIVCGGRGLGGVEGFSMLEELAAVLGGAVGASRPPCDAGWESASRQIGLTGKVVSPKLYIAVGLSGSSQHMAGCRDSNIIVAINKDPEANIFSEAHYGVVGDYRKIIPHFTNRIKQIIEK